MKNFNNFKQEIIKRCKEQSACETEFKRIIASTNFQEIVKVITDNFYWSCTHKIIDIELLENVGAEILNECNLFFNVSANSGYLLASGNATVKAWGNATVEAWGNATVRASGNATVKAWGNATVEAWGSATVRAWGNATVRASGNATVKAWGNATVEAWGSATVRAWGNVYINSINTIEHKLSDFAICRYKYQNRIVVSSTSKIETY